MHVVVGRYMGNSLTDPSNNPNLTYDEVNANNYWVRPSQIFSFLPASSSLTNICFAEVYGKMQHAQTLENLFPKPQQQIYLQYHILNFKSFLVHE